MCYLGEHEWLSIEYAAWDGFPLMMLRCKHCKGRAVTADRERQKAKTALTYSDVDVLGETIDKYADRIKHELPWPEQTNG